VPAGLPELVGGARTLGVTRERLSDMANKAEPREKTKSEQERDFFCAVSDAFRCFAQRSSILLGSAWAFGAAVLAIFVWILTGPTFHFSDMWQLIINTATTIVTFLMVFLIQNTQNRDAKAMHLKLDEVIRALKGARNQLVDLEELSDQDLKKLEEQFFEDCENKPKAAEQVLITANPPGRAKIKPSRFKPVYRRELQSYRPRI
jgi:low affinity Fe/Cu permease